MLFHWIYHQHTCRLSVLTFLLWSEVSDLSKSWRTWQPCYGLVYLFINLFWWTFHLFLMLIITISWQFRFAVKYSHIQNPIPHEFIHDNAIKWKHFPCNWPFVRGIHRSPVNSPHKGQWRGALMFSLIYVWIYDWVNNREAGDLGRYRAHCDVMVMCFELTITYYWFKQGLGVE